ncbi:MAG TPA: L,D-transpeptidase family protein [Rhizomicrobium sp.]|nr:L,D-transpeptidase family protein [Rhizomicrobium sp.]
MRTWSIAALSFVVAITTAAVASPAGAQTDDEASSNSRSSHGADSHDAMSMIVNLHTQRAYIYRDGEMIATTPVSSGKRGHRTPTGTFRVLAKQKFHRSKKYDNAPMPFMQRLTWSGIALHAGHVPGYPASHGCIRLPSSFARWLYGEPTMGMKVTITDQSRPERPAEQSQIASASTDDEDDSQ